MWLGGHKVSHNLPKTKMDKMANLMDKMIIIKPKT